METKQAALLFEAFSSEIRLDIVRLLIKHAPDGLVAGDIAAKLNIAPNKLSFHLKSIMFGGLALMEKEGRFIRYKANIPLLSELVSYLVAECCSANPEYSEKFRLNCDCNLLK